MIQEKDYRSDDLENSRTKIMTCQQINQQHQNCSGAVGSVPCPFQLKAALPADAQWQCWPCSYVNQQLAPSYHLLHTSCQLVYTSEFVNSTCSWQKLHYQSNLERDGCVVDISAICSVLRTEIRSVSRSICPCFIHKHALNSCGIKIQTGL